MSLFENNRSFFANDFDPLILYNNKNNPNFIKVNYFPKNYQSYILEESFIYDYQVRHNINYEHKIKKHQ